MVVPLIAAQRRDLPLHGLGLDPVLAPLATGRRLDLRHVLGDRGTRLPYPRGARVELRRVLAAQRAQQRGTAGHAKEGTPSGRRHRRERSTYVLLLQVRSYWLGCPLWPSAPRLQSESRTRSSRRPCRSSRAKASPPSRTAASPPRPASRCPRRRGTSRRRPTS